MAQRRDAQLVSLGYGRWVRADRVFALIPLGPDERGDGRRTYVHVDGSPSRWSPRARSGRSARTSRRRSPRPRASRRAAAAAAPRAARTRCCRKKRRGGAGGRDYAQPPVSFYVTTPIYYVNAEPHLGHAYSTIAADILARHHRQRGEDVFFLTGTDEHGEPVVQAAERQGMSPQELVDLNAPRFRGARRARRRLERLLHPHHRRRARAARPGGRAARPRQRARLRGLYEGWYCPRCADFKTEAEIGPGNTCLIHEIPLERESQENWFFRLSAFQEPLERLYAERPDFVQPSFRRNEALAFIKGGLQDVSLSRPKLSWGVPLPWDTGQVIYVWFDALLNYYTALSYAREGEDLTERFWPASLHIIGKDILKFHTVYWPAFLLAAEIAPPQHVYVHGYLLMGEKKMSKSLGNVLDPNEVIERFGPDALRFYCFREVSFGQDGNVSAAGFEARYETELANDWGNLASRTLAMIDRYRDGVVPDAELDPALAAGDDALDGIDGVVRELIDRAELTQALEAIWSRVRRLNRYVEEAKPWELAKDEANADRLDSVLLLARRGTAGAGARPSPLHARDLGPAARRARRGQPRARRVRRPRRRPAGRADRAPVPEARRPKPRRSRADDRLALPPRPLRAARRRAGRRGARGAGVDRMLSVGIDEAASEEAIAAAVEHDEVFACVGRHPNGAAGFDDEAAERIEALARHPAAVAVGETGLDFYRDRAPREDQHRAFRAQIEIARRVAKPLVIHVRDGGQTTDGEALEQVFETLRAEATGVTVILHCFSAPAERAAQAAELGLVLLVRRQLDLPERRRAARGRRRGARRAAAGRDRRAVPRPAAGTRQAEPARERGRDRRGARGAARGRATPSSRRRCEENARRVFGW